MALIHSLSTNNYGTQKYIVATSAANGTHTSLATAMADASSGDTIVLRNSVTENVTLTPGVNIVAFVGSELTPNISITGKLTMTGAGSCTISGIQLITNSDYFLEITGSAASIVNLENCYLNMSNNTGIHFTSSSGSSQIYITHCKGTFGTTGITLYVSTASGLILINHSDIFYGSATSTASSNSAAQVVIRHSNLNFPLSNSSTGAINLFYTSVECENQNATALTTAGNGTNTIDLCKLSSGSASTISIGTGTTVTCYLSELKSSNTNVVTGAGTINFSDITFSGSSSVMNASTQTGFYTNLGKYKATQQPAFFAYNGSATTNNTGDGTSYILIFGTELFDVGNNFDGTSTFTAPVTGIYQFNCNCLAANMAAANTMTINMTVVGTSANTYKFGNTSNAQTVAGNQPIGFSALIALTATDTVTVHLVIGGGAKTVGVFGGAGDIRTNFSGYLVG